MKVRALALSTMLALAPQAHAQSNSTLAETLYQEGKRLMGEKKYAEGCPKLAESQRLEPATGTVLNLAACYDAWGKHATAWTHYNDALSSARREGQDYRVKYAEDQLRALEGKLTRLQVDLAPGADVPGLEVSLDGRALPAAVFGTPMPVDPGVHVITAKAPGKKPARVEVKADAPRAVVKALVPALADAETSAAAATPASADAPVAEAPSSGDAPAAAPETTDAGQARGGGNTLAITGIIVAGLGVVGIGVGSYFYKLAGDENEKAKVLCRLGPTQDQCFNAEEQADHRTHVENAEQNRTLAYVGIGVGAAALVTGGVITVIGLGSKSSETGLRVAPQVGPALAGASLSGRF